MNLKEDMNNKPINDPSDKLFLYIRQNIGSRLIHFLADKQIGQGSADCERYWSISPENILSVYGKNGDETFNCVCDNNTWKGKWLKYEKNDVLLIPVDGEEERNFGIEIGCGENPDPDYHVRCDVMQLPNVNCVCQMDKIPFPNNTFTKLKAIDVLEHQSHSLIKQTLREWRRVLFSNGKIFLRVPNGELLIERYIKKELSIQELNYWLLGGQASERDCFKMTDSKGVPGWIWNAHHTIFSPEWLKTLLAESGFCNITINSDGGSNLLIEGNKC